MPLSERSSWMSRSRHGAPLIAYSESPLRNSVRVIVTSLNSIGSRFAELSIVSDTSARPSAGRSAVPAKMTSSILPPRNVRGPCAPSTQATASTRLDLPDPFGPTTTITPGSNSSTVLSANDLNPRSVRDFRNTPQLLLGRCRSVRARLAKRADRSWSDLAVRAEERGPARVLLADDRAPAPEAGLPVPGVHLVVLLVAALLAEQIHVLLVGERGAPVLDAVLEDLHHRPVQAAHLLGPQLVAHVVVAEPGVVEDLVGVDVADPGDELLVHQRGLELHVPLRDQLAEVVPAHRALERVETEVGELVHLVLDAVEPGHEHLAERARVDEPQLAALREGDDDVRVLGHLLLGASGPAELARHAEVDHEALPAVELHEQVLAPPLDARELLAHE